MGRLSLSAASAAVVFLALPAAAAAAPGGPSGAGPTTFALIGDTPYGDAQRVAFPALVSDVNDDPKVRMVLHAGDIKSGSSSCDDVRFADLAALYDTFADPFVITPGDNEWTDCHRTAAGGYLPTERLAAFRDMFYPELGHSLGGRTMTMTAQPDDQAEHEEYVENVRFVRSDVVFATVHVVGSDNDLAPWSQLPGGDRPTERIAEFETRRAANLAWIDAAFERARAEDAAGVVLMMQAEPVESPGFTVERARILAQARDLGRPVLLIHGDEHVYEVEREYAGVPNLTRLETYGDTATEWLSVTVDPRTPEVFSWEPRSVG
ncbi:MAG: metallophosphoesterase [Actinomycetota bacterium]|nr:metallophosphoesterase [Actinomycetota bacterium]